MNSERIQRITEKLLDQCEAAVYRQDWNFIRDTVQRILQDDAENEDAKAFLRMAGDEQSEKSANRTGRRILTPDTRGKPALQRQHPDIRSQARPETFTESTSQGAKSNAPKLYVLYSYARTEDDAPFRALLRSHLGVLKRKGVELYCPREASADEDSDVGHLYSDIRESFRKADVILLLVSPDYLSQTERDSAKKLEYDLALQNLKERGEEVQVVPVILRPCAWDETELEELEAMPPPRGEIPVSSWDDKDAAFNMIAKWLAGQLKERTTMPTGLNPKRRPVGEKHETNVDRDSRR